MKLWNVGLAAEMGLICMEFGRRVRLSQSLWRYLRGDVGDVAACVVAFYFFFVIFFGWGLYI